MKLKLFTAVAAGLLLMASGLASAHNDSWRDHRAPSYHGHDRSYRGHDRGWHKQHRPQVRKHYHAHPRKYHRGWHGAPGWRKHHHSGHHHKYGRSHDGVTIIFRGHLR